MRYSADHKERSRAGILDAAGRVFRENGFNGVGVDGLAKEAGVTSGAFYGHFSSKEEAFRETVRQALSRLATGISRFKSLHSKETDPDAWLVAFVDWYLGRPHRKNRSGGCGLPVFSGEVARADPETRAVFEAGFEEAVRLLSEAPPFCEYADSQNRARALLSLLAGGVSVSRAVRNEATADSVADGVREAAFAIVRAPSRRTLKPKGKRSPLPASQV